MQATVQSYAKKSSAEIGQTLVRPWTCERETRAYCYRPQNLRVFLTCVIGMVSSFLANKTYDWSLLKAVKMGSVPISPLRNEKRYGFGNQRDVIHTWLRHLTNWVSSLGKVYALSLCYCLLWASAIVWMAPPKLMLEINRQCSTVVM